MNRRRFLTTLAGVAASASLVRPRADETSKRDRLGEWAPTRKLGRTGEEVTMLGLGGWHFGRMSERDAQETLEVALDGGVRFFDSAESYQGGGSESRLGKLLVPKYRDVAFLMTKTTARDAESARKHLEGSLKRLDTDYLDLWQIHAITSAEDVDGRLDGGVLDVVQTAQEQGKVRYIGFTGHTRPAAHLRMLERTEPGTFHTTQMPVNLADASYESFIVNVMPKLVERGIAPLAMKTLANGGFFGGSQHGEHGDHPRVVPFRVSVQEAIHFAWSLPIAVLITGPDGPDHMREKIALARSFKQLSESDRAELIAKVADMAGRRVEFYKG